MSRDDDRVICRTPTPGRHGVTRLPRWKYDAVRTAILDAVAKAGDQGLAFGDLSAAVAARLTGDQLADLGSVGWHTTSVKLNMEVEAEIKRLPNISPQRLILA